MLDPHDAHVVLAERVDRLDQLIGLGVGQTATDLVQQQDLGVGRQRPGELEPFPVEQTQALGATVGEVHQAAELEDLDAARVPLGLGQPRAVRRTDQDVLQHGHAPEGARDLERATDPEAATTFRPQAGDVVTQQIDRCRSAA